MHLIISKPSMFYPQKKERNTARSSPSKPHEVTETRKPNAPPAKDAAEADQVGPSALSIAEEQLRGTCLIFSIFLFVNSA